MIKLIDASSSTRGKVGAVLKKTPVALFLCFSSINSHAATITVSNTGDLSGCTFRNAVENFNTGLNQNNGCLVEGALGTDDRLEFSVDTVSLSSGAVTIENDLIVNRAGSLRVEFLSSITNQPIIEILDSAVTLNRIEINDSVSTAAIEAPLSIEDAQVTMNDCSFDNNTGNSELLDIRLSTVTINNSHFTNNTGGGAINTSASDLFMNGSTVSGGWVPGGGGGARFAFGSVVLTGSRFENNLAVQSGGAIDAQDVDLTLNNSQILNNSVTNYAGGGINMSGGVLNVNGSTISGNVGQNGVAKGGGMFIRGATATITNSEISNNLASEGAGLYLSMDDGSFSGVNSSITLVATTISHNQASAKGGGILSQPTLNNGTLRLTLRNSTVSSNTSADSTGGIYALNDTNLYVLSSTVTKNTAANGAGGLLSAGGTARLYNSIIAGNTNLASTGINDAVLFFSTYNGNSNLLGTSNLTTAESVAGFVLGSNAITATSDGSNPASFSEIIGPLRRNGGPTHTHALTEGSPAIDNGSEPLCAFTVGEFDQRGRNRLDATCDIGSVEFFEQDDSSCFVVPISQGKATVFCL